MKYFFVNYRYQDNARMVAYYMAQRDPLEVAVTAVENVVTTNGFKWARPYSTKMSWFTSNSMDAILILMAPLILIVIAFVVRKTKRMERKESKSKKD